MLTELSLIGLGFLVGIRHAFDADHIVAIATLASQTKSVKLSTIVGMFWGIGHMTSLLFISALVILFKLTIAPQFSIFFEFCVGLTLVILGFIALKSVFSKSDGTVTQITIPFFNKSITFAHTHKQANVNKSEKNKRYKLSYQNIAKSFWIGIIHGLAGSAALMLLILASVTSISQSVAFVLSFSVGLLTSMVIISTLIGLPFSIGLKLNKTRQIAIITAGIISILIGIIIMYENGALLLN